MYRILITAIGSFSATYAINRMKSEGDFVVGTDIYPGEWHNISKACDVFAQAPLATSDDYIPFLLNLCQQHNLGSILPLTDLEIDVIDRSRSKFEDKGIKLLMPSSQVLSIARNKLALSEIYKNTDLVKVPPYINSERCKEWGDVAKTGLVAKPIDGRSSEGLLRIKQGTDIKFLHSYKGYIIQELIDGHIITVDYVRDGQGNDVAVPRIELLRTKNGAGTTVKLFSDSVLTSVVSQIGKMLNIMGCVNMEFIANQGNYYLIDINPRFSAGVAFSSFAGYDMVLNHIKCHNGETIDSISAYDNKIVEKIYSEVCNSIIA